MERVMYAVVWHHKTQILLSVSARSPWNHILVMVILHISVVLFYRDILLLSSATSPDIVMSLEVYFEFTSSSLYMFWVFGYCFQINAS